MEAQLSVILAVSQASTRLHSKKKVCKNYHVVGEFETTILAGLCTVSGLSGRLFKRSLNLNIAYKIKYFELICCKVSRFQYEIRRKCPTLCMRQVSDNERHRLY